MKKLFLSKLRDWFGLTRSERRATIIILVITFVVGLSRYAVPLSLIQTEIIIPEVSGVVEIAEKKATDSGKTRTYVPVQKKKYNITELNNCDSAALEALPGLGPVLSARIIKYRNLLGGYASVAQLKEVYGLSTEIYATVSGYLTADTLLIRKIDINSAAYRDLLRFPYLEKEHVEGILKYRELEGKISNCNELLENRIIDSVVYRKIKHYVSY